MESGKMVYHGPHTVDRFRDYTQMMAVSYVINNFFALPEQLAVLVAFILIMTFSLMGRIRTIAQTDVLQFGLFFLLFPVSYQYNGLEDSSN